MLYTIGTRKNGKKRLTLAALQAITDALNINRILDWRAEADELSIQPADLTAAYGETKYSHVGRTCNEARITREAEDRLAVLKGNTLLLFHEYAPGDCTRHTKLAMDLAKREPPVMVSHIFDEDVIPQTELQKVLDDKTGEYEYKSKPWRPTAADLTAKGEAALAKLAAKTSTPADVMEKAVCLCVQTGTLGNRRKLGNDRIETKEDGEGHKADKSMIRATKSLVESAELAAINSHINATKKVLDNTCLPSILPFVKSTWMVPMTLFERTINHLDASIATLNDTLIPALKAAWLQRVREAQQKLGPDFNANDYVTAEELQGEFKIDYRIVQFGVDSKVASVNGEVYKREVERMQNDIRNASLSCQQVLRAAMADLVDRMVERLQPEKDGKPKKFKDSLVGNLQEFLSMFNDRNITGDTALQALVERARQLTKGIDPDTLRNSDSTRAYVARGFEQIKTAIGAMVITRPTRKYDLDDAA